jgi:hypothetical protein
LGTLSRYSGITGSCAATRSDKVASSITAKKAFFMKKSVSPKIAKKGSRIRIYGIRG